MKSKFLRLAGPWFAIVGLLQVSGCVSDDGDDDAAAGSAGMAGTSAGSGGSSGGSSGVGGSSAGSAGSLGGSGGSGGSIAGTACANPTVIGSGSPDIADFETYDGSEFKSWFFPFGGETSTGILSGPFAYGDEMSGFPETYGMEEGNGSMYAMHIADTLADTYGGGMGLWISGCVDASAFEGVSFWVRGDAPKTTGTLTLSMSDTLTSTPSAANPTAPVGTCDGDAMTCKHPFFAFPVTDTWTEVQVPWTAFMAGVAEGAPVEPDGSNVTQLQFAVDLNFVPSEADPLVYVPEPAPYELAVDDVTFY